MEGLGPDCGLVQALAGIWGMTQQKKDLCYSTVQISEQKYNFLTQIKVADHFYKVTTI